MKKSKSIENDKTIEKLAEKLAEIFIMEIQSQKRSANTHKQKSKSNEKIAKQIEPKTKTDH